MGRFIQFNISTSVLLTISLLFLLACSPPTEKPLRVGTNIWIGYEPLYLARSLNTYENTPVKLVELTSASDVIHALRSGTLEAAALTLDETLSMIDDGFDLKVILIFDFSNGGDVLIAKPEITTLAQLEGKRVVVESTAVGAVLLDRALNSVNLDVAAIQVVSCTVDEHFSCFQNNDAVVSFGPVTSKLLDQGANLLYDSSKIPDKIVDVLVVPESTIRSHPNSLRQLLSGYFKAQKYISEHPVEAAKMMSPRLKLLPNEVLSSFDGIRVPELSENYHILSGDESPLYQTANELSQFMFERKLLQNSLELKGISNASFLPEEQQ